MYQVSVYSTFLVCLCLFGGCRTQGAGRSCKINDSYSTTGVCTKISNCTSALASLYAGVNPSVCQGKDRSIICCPIEKRISGKKCDEYTSVLKVVDGPFPLLPPAFLDTEPEEEIHCNPNHNPLISGGRDAKPEEFPYAVAIGYDDSDSPWRCGGTLISDEYVLTASHCIDTRGGRPTKLLLGDIYLDGQTSSTRTLRGISKIIKHPGFKPPVKYNDIALIKMDKKISISRAILPACLPQPEDHLLKDINKNLTVTAVGWGYLGTAESQSEVLQAVNLKGFGKNSCDRYYRDTSDRSLALPEGIIRSQMCAGDNTTEKDTCQGDSGGALVRNKDKRCVFYVVGVTSFGPRFCGYRTPGVYTNVYSYLDWIEDIVWPRN